MSNQANDFKLNPTAVEFVPSFMQRAYQPPVFNQSDVDPFEMEARCEAVVEILQDDRVRDHLNPSAVQNEPVSSHHYHHNRYDDQEDQGVNEEDIMEMMAMQEECRLEMMKFYIQSQNPNLFEDIYHDVSYPEKMLEPKPKQDTKDKKDQKSTELQMQNLKI